MTVRARTTGRILLPVCLLLVLDPRFEIHRLRRARCASAGEPRAATGRPCALSRANDAVGPGDRRLYAKAGHRYHDQRAAGARRHLAARHALVLALPCRRTNHDGGRGVSAACRSAASGSASFTRATLNMRDRASSTGTVRRLMPPRSSSRSRSTRRRCTGWKRSAATITWATISGSRRGTNSSALA